VNEVLDIYFQDWGVDATLWPDTPQARAVRGLFDNPYQHVAPGGTIGDAGTVPIFTGRSADLAGAKQGDLLRIGTSDYRIASVQPDGVGGLTRLELNEA